MSIVVPTIEVQSLPLPEVAAVPLAAYARHIQVCECPFYGVRNGPDCQYPDNCRHIWMKDERDWAQFYLAEAQWEIENEINYFLGRRWVSDETHIAKNPVILSWGHVIAGGIRATVDISLGETVSHATDPAIVGPVATTVTSEDEIAVFHPGTDLQITPSDISISGGFVTIQIPRCRMVKPEYQNNDKNGVDYETTSNFSQTVDVKRIYNDTTTQGYYIRSACDGDCSEDQLAACMYVRRQDISSVVFQICGTSTLTRNCGGYDRIKANYYAGQLLYDDDGRITRFGRQAQDAVIRLAHVKMPKSPCECDPIRELWKRDQEVIVDGRGGSLRGACPFGPEEGAWTAWRFAHSPGMYLHRGATL